MPVNHQIRIGTRGSALALTQSRWVAGRLEELGWNVSLEIIRTAGDSMSEIPTGEIDVKGLFVTEIERALAAGKVDLAVHSMKDLPPEMLDGLKLAAVPKREDPRDVLIGRTARELGALPEGAVVGTSSPRRKAMLLAMRPDLAIADLRGNLDTRLRKLDDGQFDAICLAAAGLNRLGLADRITEYLDPSVVVPAAGQGALALQVRSADEAVASAVAQLHDEASGLAVSAERAVLGALGWGCSVPLGLLASADGQKICLAAALCSLDGRTVVRERLCGAERAEELGKEMAERLLSSGKDLSVGVT